MRTALVALTLLPLILCGCQNAPPPVRMRNPTSGQVIDCGPYPNAVDAQHAAHRENECIADAERHGFMRAP